MIYVMTKNLFDYIPFRSVAAAAQSRFTLHSKSPFIHYTHPAAALIQGVALGVWTHCRNSLYTTPRVRQTLAYLELKGLFILVDVLAAAAHARFTLPKKSKVYFHSHYTHLAAALR